MKLQKGTVVLTDNDAWNSGDWMEETIGYVPQEELITLKELDRLRHELDPDEFPDIANKWDYPIDEVDHIAENDLDVVLVKFKSEFYGMGAGDYEYRFCEV